MTRFAVAVLVLMLSLIVPYGDGPACQGTDAGSQPASRQASARSETGALEGTLDADQYVLGPGDVLEIGFWAEVNRHDRVMVNPDGDVLVPPIGPLRVTGLTLSQARTMIIERLSEYYKPSIVSVSLASIRSFQIHVVGMVEQPGAFEANAVTRVSQVIARAGGLVPGASERNVLVKRGSDSLHVDLTRYLLLGDNNANPFLSDGDVVYVPPRLESVYAFGSLYRQGPYEFVEGETLAALLDLAGGLRPEALRDSVGVARFRPDDPTKSDLTFREADPEALRGFRLAAGDRVFIRAMQDWHRDARVEIIGEVRKPGVYVINEGIETLTQVIERAGGFTENASLAEARLIRGAYASTAFPIEAEIKTLEDIKDTFSEREKDLVRTMSREPKGALSIGFEKIYTAKGKRLDPPLYDGDVIDIPRASRVVRVSGQVKNPGLVTFKRGEGWGYYVRLAGGFAPGADRGGLRLVTALNGQMVKPSGIEIKPGDTVWVPQRNERSWWSVTKDVLQVLAQVATIYIVIDQIASR